MEESAPPPSGFLGSFRRIGETVLSALQNRIELFAVELQEHKVQLVSTFLWAASAMVACLLAVIMVTVTLVHLSPAKARPFVLVALCLVYIGLAWSAVAGLRRQLKEHSSPMSETINEIKKDIACLKSREQK